MQYKLVRESFKMDGRPQKMSGGSEKEFVFLRPRGEDQKDAFGGGAALVKNILGFATGERGKGMVLLVSHSGPNPTQGHFLF